MMVREQVRIFKGARALGLACCFLAGTAGLFAAAPSASATNGKSGSAVGEKPNAVSAPSGHHDSQTKPDVKKSTAKITPLTAFEGLPDPEVVEGKGQDGMDAETYRLYSKAIVQWQKDDRKGAQATFAELLNRRVPVKVKRDAMLKLADLLQNSGHDTKAAILLEKFRATYPDDKAVPSVLLRLGLIYRSMGAYDEAITRFYQVLNTTLSADGPTFKSAERFSMKARLEIAETYADRGDFDEARKIYSRLQLLDLSKADRVTVEFRTAYLYYYLKNDAEAVKSLSAFLKDHPLTTYTPQARYLLAKSLQATGQQAAAFKEVLTLLKDETKYSDDSARVNYWKRRTGNELANQFYKQGDYLSALTIYQNLARLNRDPDWLWPTVYQIGLCFERLNLPGRAVEAYQEITKANVSPTEAKEMDQSLSLLRNMAKWRLSELDWASDFQKRLQILIHPDGLGKS